MSADQQIAHFLWTQGIRVPTGSAMRAARELLRGCDQLE